MQATTYQEIKHSLRSLYREDARPWLVGFSGGKDSTMLASLVFEAVLSVPPAQRKKPVSVLCTDTRVEIPAIVEMLESTLARMRQFSEQNGLNVEVSLLKPWGGDKRMNSEIMRNLEEINWFGELREQLRDNHFLED